MAAGLGDDFQPALDGALHSPAFGESVEGGAGDHILNAADRVANINQAKKHAARHVRKREALPLRFAAEALDAGWPASSRRFPCRGYR